MCTGGIRSACEIVIGNPERERPFKTKTFQAFFPVIVMNLKDLWCDTVNYVWLSVGSTNCGRNSNCHLEGRTWNLF